MKALVLIIALLGHHAHETAPELADAIDAVCDEDRECVLDAVATCFVETRCQMHLCARNGCGPFQQLARYADHDALISVTHSARRVMLASDPQIAAEQWKIKRDKYKARHGIMWPRRYNGSERAEQYLQHWLRVRARAERVK